MHPFLHLTHNISIPSYILVISLTYCLAIFWSVKRAEKFNMPRNIALDISLCLMLGGFIGARLLHIVYEAPDYYINYPYRMFYFWQGGFVFYGGAIGAFVTAATYLYFHKIPMKPWMDFFAPIGAFGYALGRIACFLNGCCYGKVCKLPWAVSFPGVDPIGSLRHPTQVYATSIELVTLAILLALQSNKFKWRFFATPGRIFFLWIILHALNRLIMEAFRDDFRGDFIDGFSISSVISFTLIFSGILGLFWPTKKI